MGERVEYRVVWRREGMKRPKVRRFAGRPSADRWVGFMTSEEPWLYMREQPSPDDFVCGDGWNCGCDGLTVRQNAERVRAKLPPLEYIRVESRRVGPWVIEPPAPLQPHAVALVYDSHTHAAAPACSGGQER